MITVKWLKTHGFPTARDRPKESPEQQKSRDTLEALENALNRPLRGKQMDNKKWI